jgi:uncharacterized protein (TIGR03067 family)
VKAPGDYRRIEGGFKATGDREPVEVGPPARCSSDTREVHVFLSYSRMRRGVVLGLALVLLLSPVATSDDKDGDGLQGTWLPATAELAGKPFPEEVRKSLKLVVKDDKYTVTAGKSVDQGTVKLNPAAKPKELDITGVEGPNKGKTILAIYERDGDTLRVCYDLGGKERPKEFMTREGAQLFLVTYKREKP